MEKAPSGTLTLIGGLTTLQDYGTFQNITGLTINNSVLDWSDQGVQAQSNRLPTNVPITLAKNWPSQQMYEYEFTPLGQGSNLCIGTATAAVSGTELSLQPCGVNDQTLWLPETHDAVNGFEPIVAGSDTRATAPYVITAGSPGGALTTYEQASPERSAQLWEEIVGVL